MSISKIDTHLYEAAGFSSKELQALLDLLEANPSLHWLTIDPSTGTFDIVLDNQMYKTYRGCPAHFMEAYVNGWGGTGRSWNLEFGILFHKMMESYYLEFRDPAFKVNDWAIDIGVRNWNLAQMDFHSGHKEYQSMGGVQGFVGLLIAYAQRFSAENERLRVIGTEIGFGKGKEVPLGKIDTSLPYKSVYEKDEEKFAILSFLSVFLSGRIDVLVDDGRSICPLDHKTKGSLRRDPALEFEVDEGPTGYIFAIHSILPQFLKAHNLEGLLNRDCSKIIMNFISKSIPKEGDRFKRIPLLKTDYQLEQYRLRMLATAENIFRDTIRYASTGVAYRNTERCTNLYMRDCDFLAVHRQNSRANELVILNQFFKKQDIWDTENVSREIE